MNENQHDRVLDGFQIYLCLCALDKSNLSIGRVNSKMWKNDVLQMMDFKVNLPMLSCAETLMMGTSPTGSADFTTPSVGDGVDCDEDRGSTMMSFKDDMAFPRPSVMVRIGDRRAGCGEREPNIGDFLPSMGELG